MIGRTVKVIKNEIQLPLPKLPENLPKNIAPPERPNKKICHEKTKIKLFKVKLHWLNLTKTLMYILCYSV